MSTMADTVAAHVLSHADWDDEWLIVTCYCGAEATKQHDGTQYTCQEEELLHAEHVAAELAAAGYGNMADAWDEGYGIGCVDQILTVANGEQCDTPNPYRGAGHE